MPEKPDPVATATDDARAQALALLAGANHAALAVLDPATGTPGISRIAFGLTPEGDPLTLISDLTPHTAALRAQPLASFMVGEVGAKGDPLIHPRLMVQVRAEFVERAAPSYAALRAHYLQSHPKSKLYVDFTDFHFVVLRPVSALLNGGFGRAFRLTAEDLRPL